MTLMLRLDPAAPPLWRDAETLQFGAPAVATVSIVAPWQERLIAELARGMGESGVDVWAEFVGVHPREVRGFLSRLSPAIRPDVIGDPLPAPRAVVDAEPASRVVHGGGREAWTGAAAVAHAVTLALELAGWSVGAEREHPDARPDDTGLPAAQGVPLGVIVADHAVDPRRAHAHLLADRPYLPVVAGTAGVVVGPLVVPGSTACTTCVDLHRRDDDAQWPLVMAQLLGARPAAPTAEDCLAGATEVVRMLGPGAAWAAGAPLLAAPGSAWTVRGTTRTERVWSPHPECGCRIPSPTAAAVPVTAGVHTGTPATAALPLAATG